MQFLDTIQNGPRLNVSTSLEDVEIEAANASSLVLEFDDFRDGRGFSLASVLRERGYTGRLIAAGALLPDQVRHLRRSGFDTVELKPGTDLGPWRAIDLVFSASYQPAADVEIPVWRRRQEG